MALIVCPAIDTPPRRVHNALPRATLQSAQTWPLVEHPIMPLKGQSVGSDIKEFRTGKTFAHTKAKFGAKRAQKQAIAVALSVARKKSPAKAPSPLRNAMNHRKSY